MRPSNSDSELLSQQFIDFPWNTHYLIVSFMDEETLGRYRRTSRKTKSVVYRAMEYHLSCLAKSLQLDSRYSDPFYEGTRWHHSKLQGAGLNIANNHLMEQATFSSGAVRMRYNLTASGTTTAAKTATELGLPPVKRPPCPDCPNDCCLLIATRPCYPCCSPTNCTDNSQTPICCKPAFAVSAGGLFCTLGAILTGVGVAKFGAAHGVAIAGYSLLGAGTYLCGACSHCYTEESDTSCCSRVSTHASSWAECCSDCCHYCKVTYPDYRQTYNDREAQVARYNDKFKKHRKNFQLFFTAVPKKYTQAGVEDSDTVVFNSIKEDLRSTDLDTAEQKALLKNLVLIAQHGKQQKLLDPNAASALQVNLQKLTEAPKIK